MSTQHDWKPGDVAMLEVGCHANRHVEFFVGSGWQYGEKWVVNDPAIVTARPLLVIDVEDREQVERLVSLLHETPWFRDQSPNKPTHTSVLQQALRAMLAPPKPPILEPSGLGAVVVDSAGVRWVHAPMEPSDPEPWTSRDGWRTWPEIDAREVLSEGVTS